MFRPKELQRLTVVVHYATQWASVIGCLKGAGRLMGTGGKNAGSGWQGMDGGGFGKASDKLHKVD
ncbi:hypothetical protein [Heliophilum fasciatum]|uniref:hypothetical protein n=1 Tax=Heliophilum fasciatum TaxID=35700 RepID=UPI0010514EF2|nr:hypothetical protein [Heliophilum fasciatum]MCW2276651.1 hypothetical protein [Heliophilum fasciatum]